MTHRVAGAEGVTVRRPGGALRLLPMVSALAFVFLALAAGSAYEREARWLTYCDHLGIGAACLSRMVLLQTLVALWLTAAAAVCVLMAMETLLIRRSRGLEVPPMALLVYGIFLIAFGIAGFFAGQEAGYGRLPHATADAFLYAYLTGALFLFALAFLDYRPRGDAVSKSAVVVATAHGIIGTILAVAYASALLYPPVTSA